MTIRHAMANAADGRWPDGPVHRSIVAVDLEGSTGRTNLERGELRRAMYDLLGHAMQRVGILPEHREELTDRGDGVLVLIRPHDSVPKTLLLGRLMPVLTALLLEHNATASIPELRLRLRVVVHAGEIHADDWGFYGEDLDLAFRLMDAPQVKKALREAVAAPLVLVVSEEVFTGIVRHGYVQGGDYEPLVRVRLADRLTRGWVHLPAPAQLYVPSRDQPTARPHLTIVEESS